MALDDFSSFDALGLAALVRTRKVKPAEIMDAAIARAEALNPRLNAIVFSDPDGARAAAKGKLPKGAFTGVPMLLKDMRANVVGWPTRSGSRYVPATPATQESNTVARFKGAGLVPFGKTNVPEFGILPTTESKLYGAARNPWNLEHSTGGSSGGSAAAVAAGIVPIAHATDGGGSIRIPASACGLVGLKATRGRVSQGPEAADATMGLSMDGVVSKSVRDTAAALDALCAIDYGDPYWAPPPEGSYLDGIRRKPKRLRLAVSLKMMNGTAHDPEVTAAVKATAKLCEGLGHQVEIADPPARCRHADQRLLDHLVRQCRLFARHVGGANRHRAVACSRRRPDARALSGRQGHQRGAAHPGAPGHDARRPPDRRLARDL
ncbi:MAG: amidase family protein [Rhizomicrobium sp.]